MSKFIDILMICLIALYVISVLVTTIVEVKELPAF